MPREARRKSESGIYHIMLRGINRQQIFEDTEDYEKFLDILIDCKGICGYKIYAYCLMGNHIHLLMGEGEETLEQTFKRICGRFVYWYNVKYQRVGHLFQDRFKSEPVDTEEYFFTVLRYIHQNPIKAKLCKHAEDYVYSSYPEYLGKRIIVDTEYVLELCSIAEFVGLNKTAVETACMDIADTAVVRVTDEQARELIRKVSKCESVSDFQLLEQSKRDKCLTELKEKGLSIRQLNRLTGVSISVIRKN